MCDSDIIADKPYDGSALVQHLIGQQKSINADLEKAERARKVAAEKRAKTMSAKKIERLKKQLEKAEQERRGKK